MRWNEIQAWLRANQDLLRDQPRWASWLLPDVGGPLLVVARISEDATSLILATRVGTVDVEQELALVRLTAEDLRRAIAELPSAAARLRWRQAHATPVSALPHWATQRMQRSR